MMKIKFKESLIVVVGLILGVIILMVSLMRATLDKVINEARAGEFRDVPMLIEGKEIYKLPYSGKLPGERFYFLKKIRNWGWETLSRKEKTKIELSLILADKKMSEAWALFKKEQESAAFTTGDEAVNKLKYAYQLLMEANIDKESREILREKIIEKDEIYKEILANWKKQ